MGANEAASDGQGVARDIVELIQRMGQTINLSVLYGVRHKVAAGSLESSFAVLRAFLDRHGQALFSVSEGKLLVNGAAAPETPLAGSIATRLTDLQLLSFVVEPGFSIEEYRRLVELMVAPAARTGVQSEQSDGAADLQFEHLQATKFTYQRVAGDGAAPAPTPEQTACAAGLPDLENVMAFLKGDPQADAARSSEDIRALASDAEKLAELILRTVEVQARAANLADGESLCDLVVGCVARAVDRLTGGAAARSAKGRAQIKKSLVMLEESLLQRLHELAGGAAAEAVEKLVTDRVESLDMDALAAKYVRGRRAAEDSADKLRRLILQSGGDAQQMEELRGRLKTQGLDPEGWRELFIRRAEPDSRSEDGAEDVRRLVTLMSRMEEVFSRIEKAGDGKPSDELQELVAAAGRQTERIARRAESSIEKLKRVLEGDTTVPAITGKALRQILAEIIQDLSQPLQVISMAFSMLETGGAGRKDGNWVELLSMARVANQRMAHLIQCMIRIVGTPVILQPDRAVLDAVYNSAAAGAERARVA
jgi:hypothetical protein